MASLLKTVSQTTSHLCGEEEPGTKLASATYMSLLKLPSFAQGWRIFLGHRNFRTKTKESQTSQSFQFSFDLIPKSPALKVVEGLFQDPS